MKTATKKPRKNVFLPEEVHERVKEIGANTHRSIVGTIDWLSTEAKRLGWDGSREKKNQPAAESPAA